MRGRRGWVRGVVVFAMVAAGCVERALPVPLAEGAPADASAVADLAISDTSPPAMADAAVVDAAVADAAPPDADCPTRMVEVTAPADGGTRYCVDSTEVDNDDYASFLSAKAGDTSGQEPACAWNTSYVPALGWPVVGKGSYPMVNVDWCDAFAYCRWAGKRLCPPTEWSFACSSAGAAYPYGGVYDGMTCNDLEYGASHALPVGSVATCQGGVVGLYDMSGNVWEWVSSCNDGGGIDLCDCRGGGWWNGASTSTCGYIGNGNRRSQSDGVGFRCCASPLR